MSKKNILRIILIIVLVCFFLPYDTVTYINPSASGKVDTSRNDQISKIFSKDNTLDPEDIWNSGDSEGLEDVGDIGDRGDIGSFAQKDTTKKSYPRLIIISAFAVAIAGLVITFIRSKKAVLFSAIAAVAGFVCTIVSTFIIRSWMITNSSAEVIIKVNYQAGFYLILAGFAAAAAFGFYASYNKKPVQTPYMGQQGPYAPPDYGQQPPFVNMEQQYAPSQQENISRFCSECGSKMEPGDGFCSNCGTKVQ